MSESTTPGNNPARSVNSPEFRKEMCEDLKDMVKQGHVKLAPGNEILECEEILECVQLDGPISMHAIRVKRP